MNRIEKDLNSIFVLMLCGLIIGAFVFQFIYKEAPCPLCLLQRLAMIGVMCGGLLNLRFGIHIRHYVISLFAALIGAAISVRQILLHIEPGSIPFGTPVLGLSLYTWAFISFMVAIVTIAVILFVDDIRDPTLPKYSMDYNMDLFSYLTFAIAGLVVLANLIFTIQHCGLGPCEG
jgi:disulfide bond formation protein DsbB